MNPFIYHRLLLRFLYFMLVFTVFINLLYFIAFYQGTFHIGIYLINLMLYCWLFFLFELLVISWRHLALIYWVNGHFYELFFVLHLIALKFLFKCLHVKCLLSLVILTVIMTALTKNASN